eukprot:Hpha_TRINITY_DN15710_c3_g2::TRINITY_DN15710_c3_g2_i1::g.41677::m.41677
MGLISVRNLTLGLSVALVVISGGITGYMSITTGEKALDDTRNVYSNGLSNTNAAADRGLNSCFAAGLSNSRMLAEQLMAKVVDNMVSQVTAYLAVPETAVKQIADWLQQMRKDDPCFDANGKHLDCAQRHPGWLHGVYQPYVFSIFKEIANKGVTEIFTIQYPAYNQTLVNYIHSPITATAAASLGVPLDHKQLLMAYYPRSHTQLCKNTYTKAECQAVGKDPSTLPAWMPEETWRINPGGCLWCAPDSKRASNPEIPYAANKEHFDTGYCSTANACEPGFLKDPPNYKSRPWVELSTVNAKGIEREAGCVDFVDSARKRDADPVTCAVPRSLAAVDFAIMEAISNDRFREENRLLWGPVNTKGPLNNLLVYQVWNGPDAWDYKDTMGRAEGIVLASIDTSSMSLFMKKIIEPLQPGTVLYGVQQNPHFIREAPINYECKDDRAKVASMAGIPCSILTAGGALCNTDINDFEDTIQRFHYIGDICPVSCNRCGAEDFDGQGVLLGTTHGRAFAPMPLNDSSYGDIGLEDKYPVQAEDCEDPVVRSHARYMQGLRTDRGRAWNALEPELVHEWLYEPDKANGTIKLAGEQGYKPVPAEEGDPKLFWVKILPVIQQEKALRLHFVLLVLRDEAMKLIDEATTVTKAQAVEESEKVRKEIEEQSAKVDDDRETNFNIMIIVVVCCCVVLMIVSVFFVLSIIRPLLELEYEMAEVATMHLETIDTDRTPHKLEEVGNMQRSFFIMVKNLIEYRNYMPQSVLQDLEEDEEEEEEQSETRRSTDAASTKKSQAQSGVSTASKRKSSAAQSKMSRMSQSQRSVLLRDKPQQKNSAMEGGLKKKPVSLVVINLKSWHKAAEVLTDCSEAHAGILSTILEVLNPASKAVPETFCGDRITISWNAVKACGTHRPKAVEVAEAIDKKLKMSENIVSLMKGEAIETSIAVVTGEVRAGNAGCMGMKKFTFFSPNVTWLYALERIGKKAGCSFVADQFIFNETKNNYYFRTVELVRFEKRSPKNLTVHEMTGKKEAGEDEWMYQLEEGEKSDPNAAWNNFVAAAIKGDGEAADLLAKLKDSSAIPQHIMQRFAGDLERVATIEPLEVLLH